MGVTELLWVKILLRDTGTQIDRRVRLYYDNKVVINLSNNPILLDCMKHVDIDRHFIREKIDSKELALPYKTQDQIIDVFTKGLCCNEFERNIYKLCMFDIYVQLEGEC